MHILRCLTLLILLAFSAGGLPCAAGEPRAEVGVEADRGIPLPVDPTIVQGRLSNGLRFAVAPMPEHGSGRDSVTFLLQIGAGSAFEADDQIGAAQLAADLASAGLLSESPEAFGRTLDSLGADRDRALRSYSTFDSTRFTLTIPLGEGESLSSADISRAVDLLAALISGAERAIEEEPLERAKRDILARQRAWAGPSQRITARAMPQLFGDSVFAKRVPIYTSAVLQHTDHGAVEEFIAAWYSPGSATMVVSGPVDPQVVRRTIERSLGPLRAGNAPDPPDLRVARPDRGAVRVETDPAIAGDIVQLMIVEQPGPPLDTHIAVRDHFSQLVAVEALNRRLQSLSRSQDSATLQAGAFTNPDAGSYRMNMLSVSGSAGSWAKLTREAVASVHSARELGFGPQELDAARRKVLSGLESEAASEAEASSGRRAAILARQISRGDTPASKEQMRRVGAAIVPHLNAEEVRRSLAGLFDPRTLSTLVVTADADPGEGQVGNQIATALRLDAAAVARSTPFPPARDLFDERPEPGTVVELVHEADLDITSAMLSSGVRLHHRPMDEGSGRIEIALSMLGGQIEQTPETNGLTDAIRALDSQPATRSRSGLEVAAALDGRSVDLRVGVSPESVTLRVSTTPDDFELAMQLLAVLVRQPLIEPAAFERWRSGALASAARARTEPSQAALAAYQENVQPDLSHRGGPLDEQALEGLTLDRANAWLERLVRESPLTLAITGDIDRAHALRTAASLLGDLPKRPAASEERLGAQRSLDTPAHPVEVRSETDLATDAAAVVIGFRSADAAARSDAIALDIAAEILGDRLRDSIGSTGAISGSVLVWNIDGEVHRGSGRFWVRALVSPDEAEAAQAVLMAELERLSSEGPTESELQRAIADIAQRLTRRGESPAAWAESLARNAGLGGEPVAVLSGASGVLEQIDTSAVSEVLSRYATPERSFRITVLPRVRP